MNRSHYPFRLVLVLAPLALGSVILTASACRPAAPEVPSALVVARTSDPELLHGAVGKMTAVMTYDIFNPPQAARAYTYASIAAYEASITGHPELRSFAGQLTGFTPAPAPPTGGPIHAPLAGVHAFLLVAEALTFSDEVIAEYHEGVEARFREAGLPDALVRRSIAHGDSVAKHVLAWAGKDGYRETRGAQAYTVSAAPGRWRPTPPAYIDGVEPNWMRIRPFVLDSAAQMRPPPPHPYSVAPGSPFYRELMEVYETRRTLTDEQRLIASFWDCNPFKVTTRGHAMFATKKLTPGGHWIGITGTAARARNLDFQHAAEAYARTAIALADGFLSAWEEKYRSNVVRPETVINEHVDDAWEPLLQTPPFPEYPSGHSVISSSAAVVLTDLFGDDFAFRDTTEVPFGLPTRDFPSFRAAAEEAAISRLYGGIHFRRAAEEGLKQGRRVGELVVERVRTRRDALAVRR